MRLRLEANTAPRDFELVNDWVNLDESDGQTHQRSLIRLIRVGRAKKQTQGRTNLFQFVPPESSLLLEDLLKADDIHAILTGSPGKKK